MTDPAHDREPDAWRAIGWALKRDLRIALHTRGQIAVVLVFYLLVTSLFPLAVSPEKQILATIAPGVVWVAALLASLLALPHLFASDHADGSLEQIVLAAEPLPALVAGKVIAHWISTALPVIALTPLTALQFGLTGPETGILLAALLLGTPVIAWFGAIGAALTLDTRGGASLLALLILPLAVPVLVFGSGVVDALRTGTGASAHLSLLGAGLLISAVIGPFVTAMAVKIAYE